MRLNAFTQWLALNVLRPHAPQFARVRGYQPLLRNLFPPTHQGGIALTVPFGAFAYRAKPGSWIDWNVVFLGCYEPELLSLMARYADQIPHCVFCDVGANVGHHSLFMAAHCESVHAFEPYPPLWPELEEKLATNRLDSVTLHRVGLGDTDADLPFEPPHGDNLGTGRFSSCSDRAGAPVVTMRRGDEYLEAAGIAHVDVIKIDVEGWETAVLKGLSETLERDRPLLIVEVCLAAIRSPADLSALLPSEYGLFVLRRAHRLTARLTLRNVGKTWRSSDESLNVIAAPFERESFFRDFMA
jgi:FkbM family methyltransferase